MSFHGGTVYRAPSYFVWNHRKHVSSSPRSSPHRKSANTNMNNTQEGRAGDDAGPSPRKMRSPRSRAAAVAGADNQSTDTKSSGGDSGGPSSAVSIGIKHKDPDRIKKDREREERVRQAREKLEEERKKKLVELYEQQRQAQENREKQLEMRRKKIEDLRRRDVERRAEVEKRRKEREDAERSRRETLLLKAEERVARYEAWKRGGQKGGRSHVLGFGSATPRDICQPFERPRRSSSHSALVRRSPNGSDSDYSFRPQRRALSACSTVRRHCCVDLNRTAPSAPSRPKSVMTLSVSSTGSASSSAGGVKLRENKSPRKPRPASVGTSMPSFVNLDAPKSSPRSKSTDRLARERSRPRTSASAHRTEEKEPEKKTADKSGARMSRRTLERLSTPRHASAGGGDAKETPTSTPRRESPLNRKPSLREKTPKEAPAKSSPQPAKASPAISSARAASPSTSPRASSPASRTPSRTPVRVVSPSPGADEDGGSGATPSPRATPSAGVEKPAGDATPSAAATTTTVTPSAPTTTTTTTPSIMEKSTGDITAEEYKAKLAEKRRQAREKAEKEAEEEKRRQEELERQEEERRLREEEEQRREEEEILRLAEEARRAEEERLQKAIEAEEARKAEEAARLEEERLAKEEAERKAKEEAERLEQERQEKARKEEEERLERKKRLEMIMKRVKTDNTGEGTKEANKSLTSSPTKSVASTASSDASPIDPDGNKTLMAVAAQSQPAPPAEEKTNGTDSGAPAVEEESQSPANGSLSPTGGPSLSPVSTPAQETAPVLTEQPPSTTTQPETTETVESTEPSPVVSGASTPRSQTPENGVDKPKFKSALLQKLVEGKDVDAGSSPGGGPRFKSPLLQNLLGKTKVGARMGLSQDHSLSTPNLSQVDGTNNGQGSNNSLQTAPLSHDTSMSSSMIDMGTDSSSHKETMNRGEDKDVDTSEESSSSSHSSPSRRPAPATVVANGSQEIVSSNQQDKPVPMDISGPMDSSATAATSGSSFWSGHDSGASYGSDDLHPAAPSSSLQVSLNGHGPVASTQGQGLEDSSISMRSVESVTSSITDSATGTGSVFSSISSLPQGQGHSTGDKDFEELIDLSLGNKTSPGTTTTTTTTGVTLLDNADDVVNFNKLEEGSEGSSAVPPPFIAFEETNTIRHPDADILS